MEFRGNATIRATPAVTPAEALMNSSSAQPTAIPTAASSPNTSSSLSIPSPAGESLYTFPELVACAVGFYVLIAVSLLGNGLVLAAVARTRKLQNATNVFVVNLGVSDALSGLAFLWSVPGMVSSTPGYPLVTEAPCVASAALVYVAVACGLNSLVCIALNRCVLITRPRATYRWLYTPRKIAAMVLAAWLVPACAVVVPPLCGVGDLGFDPQSRTCTDVDGHPGAAAYDKVQFGAFYPLQLVLIVASYALIWRHIRKHFRKRRRLALGGPVPTSTAMPSAVASAADPACDTAAARRARGAPRSNGGGNFGSGQPGSLRRAKTEQVAVTKNLFVIVFVFAVCFTPLAVMVVLKSGRFQLYGGLMLFLSGCINPFVYAAKHPHLGPVLRALVRCRHSPE